jgi:hypothetical protein
MRRLLKFLHTMGAIGLMGAMGCLLVLLAFTPTPNSLVTSSLAEYALIRQAMGAIAGWIFMPSLALTLVAGLVAMGLNPGYQSAGWAIAKLATGVLVFEAGLTGVVGPMQDEAERSANVLAGRADIATLAQSLGPEQNTLWLLLAIATVNVVLGIWRPRFTRLKE